MLFVVVYECDPRYKGLDEYLVRLDGIGIKPGTTPVTTANLEEAEIFNSKTAADTAAETWPTLDEAHKKAKVVTAKFTINRVLGK